MVHREASQGRPFGDRVHQLHPHRDMPALRVPPHQERREEERRDTDLRMPLPEMRQGVQPAHEHHIRLQKDPAERMGRIPHPSFRVPFRRHGRDGQQKRRIHGPLLAREGVHRAPGIPGPHRFGRPGLDRRDLRLREKIEARANQGREKAEGAFEEPEMRVLRDRRRRGRAHRRGRREAQPERGREGLSPAHPMLLPRRP